ncbi:7-cyano-7-deazaguanine synthase [Anaeromyxobacter diazotrophicus]|uniref:7-cyano-7-deazaguanine synthase n=2 Tax=Anaeromyxobacter diazotrophicus TaxID=2590199 RepID=A0A7I9VK04_9BACT|nr:7-cyano-7-deazaguanine synthase [Anaeromyxobacter diazotrophicus]
MRRMAKRKRAAPRAVVLLSGGLDSSTCLAVARRDGFEAHALSVNYGQRHRTELDRARRVARALGAADHRVVRVDLSAFGGSALTDAGVAVPKDRPARAMGRGIPVTYVPARNTVLLALALAHAETLGASDIYVGVNAIDYSGYPDCRPAFIRAFERLARVATKAGVEGRPLHVRAPLLRLSKAGIVRLGTALGVPYRLTLSCYDPVRGRACGRCDACELRRKGFAEAGVPDPTVYV